MPNYLEQLGLTQWQLRAAASNDASAAPHDADWEDLAAQVKHCVLCELCHTRKNTVFGVGTRQADLLLIGEAPGATEDARGEPFVGAAGQLLDKMLAAIQLSRDTVYIANILKCRPPQNRDPLPHEITTCLPYLERQIKLIQPKLILTLGRIAAQTLLQCSTSLSKLRGQTFHIGAQQIPLITTYHPAYLLRNPADKRNAYQDLLRTQALLLQTGGDKSNK